MATDLGNGTIRIESGDNLYTLYGPNWREISGYTGDPRSLSVGTILPNPKGGTAPAQAPAPASTDSSTQSSGLDSYKNLITQWYSMKPATPGAFNYSPEQEAADKRTVGEQYKPYYQEQATTSGQNFETAIKNARLGFAKRGLWGAAGTESKQVDPSTGLTYTTSTPNATGGINSGLSQVGQAEMTRQNNAANTAFGRAYTQAVAQGVQNRQAEAQDVYTKTVTDPYTEQYKAWLAQMSSLSNK